jgi:hypothetical protein
LRAKHRPPHHGLVAVALVAKGGAAEAGLLAPIDPMYVRHRTDRIQRIR